MFLPKPFGRRKKRPGNADALMPGQDERDLEVGGQRGNRDITIPSARANLIDYPPQWREKQCIMQTWSYLSMSSLLFMFCCPHGAILGIVGSSMYTCNCCVPRNNPRGLSAAFCINVISFVALFLDIITAVFLIALGTFYILAECPYTEGLCDFRALLGIVVYGGSVLVFARFVVALNVFLGMRDYQREIHREELLEQRLAEEIETRFQEYQQRRKERKSSKRVDAPSTSA